MARYIPVDDHGRALGEHSPRAVLTDAQAELIREMYGEGFYSYRGLAARFDVHKSTIRDIVKFRRRKGLVARYRKVDNF